MSQLIINNYDKLSEETQEFIEEELAGHIEVQGNYEVRD